MSIHCVYLPHRENIPAMRKFLVGIESPIHRSQENQSNTPVTVITAEGDTSPVNIGALIHTGR